MKDFLYSLIDLLYTHAPVTFIFGLIHLKDCQFLV